jgi:hypothetical protein
LFLDSSFCDVGAKLSKNTWCQFCRWFSRCKWIPVC